MFSDMLKIPVTFEVRYPATHADIEGVELIKDDNVTTLKELVKEKLGKVKDLEEFMQSNQVHIQPMWKDPLQTAPSRTKVEKFLENNGRIIVRGTSTASALLLSTSEGIHTLQRAMLPLQAKNRKLALRALVDAARRKVWTDALKLKEVNEEELKAWMKSHRVFGQSESSWKLRMKALEELYPAWKEQLVLDPDMFATINSEEYNKVLCQPAHEFGADEQKVAVESVDSTLSGFYQQVYSFVHK